MSVVGCIIRSMTRTLTLVTGTITPITSVCAPSEKLALVTRLTFTDFSGMGRGSNKFHYSVLFGNKYIVQYGRVGNGGPIEIKSFENEEKAAAKYWGLIREKVGKGYHVDSAKVVSQSLLPLRNGSLDIDITRQIDWGVLAPASTQGVGYPEKLGLSPRTPKQGAEVFLTLTNPVVADKNKLIACAMANPSERFLLPMVLSHPACPREANVIASLLAMGANIATES